MAGIDSITTYSVFFFLCVPFRSKVPRSLFASRRFVVLRLISLETVRTQVIFQFCFSSPHLRRTKNREGAATPAAGALARSACETTAPAPPATAAEPELEMEGQLLQAAERWTRSAQAADSDVRSAEEEVGRVAEGLRQRRQRDVRKNASKAWLFFFPVAFVFVGRFD